jgi:soluble lytic murein transglycosylase-like protein
VPRASFFRIQDIAGILTAAAAVFGFVVAEIPRTETMLTPAITGYMLIEPVIAGSKSVNVCQTSALEIERYVDDIARKERVPHKLLTRLIQLESGYRPCAVSSKGALGLMQLMPATLSELKVSDPFDPKQNLKAGVTILKRLSSQYRGEWKLALSAYNAGPAAVDYFGGVPPYPETMRYVKEILGEFDE